MNIVINTHEKRYIVRPDTTWKRDDEGLYVPDFAGAISFTPILYARISRAGRSIGEKFAYRYYDGVNFGVLLYPEALLDGSEQGFACASCIDHTTFLPLDLLSCTAFASGETDFRLECDGKTIFEYSPTGPEMISKAIAEASGFIYLRTGDILAIELDSRKSLWSEGGGEKTLMSFVKGRKNLQFYVK